MALLKILAIGSKEIQRGDSETLKARSRS
jgi:hypothetical protein